MAQRPELRILVVDDEELVRHTLKMLLGLDGHRIEGAADAEQALDFFAPGKFDVVITDYDMPGIKGDALAASIRRLDPTQPLIMISGHMEMIKADESCSKSVDFVLAKPFALGALLEAIAVAVAAKRAPSSPPYPCKPSS